MVSVCRSNNNLARVGLSFHHTPCGSQKVNPNAMLGGKCPYPRRHLICPYTKLMSTTKIITFMVNRIAWLKESLTDYHIQ